jgi:3-dehydroquinate dehydratase type I
MANKIQNPKSKFCIPITGKNIEEVLTQIKKAEKEADLTELRLDYLEEKSFQNIEKALKEVRKKKTKEMIITIRSKRQGGFSKINMMNK